MDRPTTSGFDNFALNAGPTSFRRFVRSDRFTRRPDLYLGGVVCDYLAYSNFGGHEWQNINPLDTMKQNGLKWVRVGVTTVSSPTLRDTPPEQWGALSWRGEFWSSREFAGEIMRQAQARGYRLNLFMFLSNTAAHAGMQNAPPEWAGLSVAETAQRVDQYSYDTARYYMDRGLNVEIYDIGNEIDFGILNFRPGDRIPIPPGVDITNNMTYMRENVWNIEAQLLQASITGIKRANPNAKIVLHASGVNVSRSDVFVKTFFKTMADDGVDYDYAGLSNPYNGPNWTVPNYSTDCWFHRLQELIDYCGTLNKKVIFSEASYPSNAQGTVGAPMPEFSYSPQGQAAWTHQYLRFVSNQPNVLGFFWFYPDYHTQQNVDPTLRYGGLFNSPTQVQPAMTEFRVNLARSSFDYDGDGRSDISVFRPSTGAWYLQRSTAGLYGAEFGYGTDKLAPADHDGDGKTDIAVYRPSSGLWYVLNSSDGTVSYKVFGIAEDLPVPADYDGDGKADIAVFRPSTATWYRQNSSDGSFYAIQFGLSEDKPTVGDFDGDGKGDIAIFRPSDGAWYQLFSSDGSLHGRQFGFASDVITPADYDGDSKTDVAVFRPSDGYWYIANSSNDTVSYAVFGLPTDIPTPGDYDGDSKADVSVFRPSDGTWYRINSSNGSFTAFPFGANGDRPTQTAFRY
jgi:arabinogalactan endo-1,4-beta-galactosidase